MGARLSFELEHRGRSGEVEGAEGGVESDVGDADDQRRAERHHEDVRGCQARLRAAQDLGPLPVDAAPPPDAGRELEEADRPAQMPITPMAAWKSWLNATVRTIASVDDGADEDVERLRGVRTQAAIMRGIDGVRGAIPERVDDKEGDPDRRCALPIVKARATQTVENSARAP